jgi:hypothetical protein
MVRTRLVWGPDIFHTYKHFVLPNQKEQILTNIFMYIVQKLKYLNSIVFLPVCSGTLKEQTNFASDEGTL